MDTWLVRLPEFALLVLAAEVGWMLGRRRRGLPTPALRPWALGVASGACLLLAVRMAVAGAAWPAWAAALALSGMCHAAEIALRWPRIRPS